MKVCPTPLDLLFCFAKNEASFKAKYVDYQMVAFNFR